jgi:hypothetical protein
MLNLCLSLSKSESLNMWLDITKFLTIVLVVHLLLYSIDDYGELFSERVLKLFLYLTISLIIYHLIVKKFIIKKFTNKKLSKKSMNAR